MRRKKPRENVVFAAKPFQSAYRKRISNLSLSSQMADTLHSKQNTIMKGNIPAAERLAVTLRYLASVLNNYLDVPSTEEEWIAIAKEFEKKLNFPNCIGSLEGKHVLLSNSIVLFALVDASCNFLYIYVGTNGRLSDSAIFSKSTLFSAIENRALGVPGSTRLLNQFNDSEIPFLMVADDVFPPKSYLMKPYPKRNLTRTKGIFNYHLSRARMSKMHLALAILSTL
nr:uncharacterized protein LOC122271254 [Parasteatoda tepidariorum]